MGVKPFTYTLAEENDEILQIIAGRVKCRPSKSAVLRTILTKENLDALLEMVDGCPR